MSAAALVDEAVTEIDRSVVDDLRLLLGEQLLVTAMRRDKAFSHGRLLQARDAKDCRDAGNSAKQR
jgi:hypothetical protein